MMFQDGKLNLIQAASVSIHKSHGQYIENVHLQEYRSEEHFWNVLYKHEYSKVLRRAEEFLDGTGGPGDDVMIFIRSAPWLHAPFTMFIIPTLLVAGWTLVSTNMNRCRVTTVKFLRPFTIASRKILAR
jgi:hypothetical protein